MSNSIRVILLAVAALALAACATKKPVETPEQPVEPPTQPTEVDTHAADMKDPVKWLNGQVRGYEKMMERTIYFDFDQSDIKSQYREVLRVHGEFMSRFGDQYVMTLEGHADERGTREYNLALGERRNTSVSNFLSAQGAGNADSVSYGEERPVCTQSDDSCWSRNRRVEIVYEAR